MLIPNYDKPEFVQPQEEALMSIMDKTPTHALFIQHYISLLC